MDEDIQYIGRILPAHPVGARHGPITGIQLTVPDTGDEPSQTLFFYKARTNTVQIGRASSATAGKGNSADTATFRCPVISRRHAKIVFATAGHVYIIDLSSHHGTHVLKHGDTVSKMLAPGVPISLEDGDVITFGKSVGKDDYLVRPVTVHVRLLHEDASPSSSDKGKQPSRSTSGRYGLYTHQSPSRSAHSSLPSSPSSSDFSSPSDHDLPADDSDRPEEYPITRSHPESSLPSLNRLGLLRHLLPPLHPLKPLSPYHSPEKQSSKHHWFYSDDSDEFMAPIPVDSPPQLEDIEGPQSIPPRAGTQSPAIEPFVIGAFPNSRAVSPSHSAVGHQVISVSPDPESPVNESPAHQPSEGPSLSVVPEPPRSLSAIIDAAVEAAGVEDEPIAVPSFHAFDNDVEMASGGPVTRGPDPEPPMEVRLTALNDALVNLRGSVLRVHIAHRKTQADQKIQSDRSAALDKRVDETNVLFKSLWNRVEGAYGYSHELREELATFRERLDVTEAAIEQLNLRDESEQIDTPPLTPSSPSAEVLATALADRDEVKASVATLHRLVDELKALRDSAVPQVAAELARLQDARVQAEAKALEIDSLTVAATSSLKRKRSDDLESSKSTVIEGKPGSSTGVTAVATPRPTKRSRRVVANVVHTAAAMTVGAVAAWSALAFA